MYRYLTLPQKNWFYGARACVLVCVSARLREFFPAQLAGGSFPEAAFHCGSTH